MLSANKHGGSCDNDILRLVFTDFPELDIDATGFSLGELEAMDINIKIDVPSPLKSENEIVEEESDEEYLANEAEGVHDSQLSKENIDMVNRDQPKGFDEVQETTKVANKQYIIIINCDSDDHKAELKESIKSLVEEKGGRFF